MDFFGQQNKSRRESTLLLLAFTTAIVLNAMIINVIAGWIAIPFAMRFDIERWYVSAFVIGLLWLHILGACYKRWRSISKGGGIMAESFGAEEISKTDVEQERMLNRVVAEMAVASSQKTLPVYCLRNDIAINAFVLGDDRSPALVVTQGFVDNLDRDEMTSVVAHEYGHIVNKDLTINMRMLIALAGLNSVHEAGTALW